MESASSPPGVMATSAPATSFIGAKPSATVPEFVKVIDAKVFRITSVPACMPAVLKPSMVVVPETKKKFPLPGMTQSPLLQALETMVVPKACSKRELTVVAAVAAATGVSTMLPLVVVLSVKSAEVRES